MPLSEYNKKRKFEKTPEPKGASKKDGQKSKKSAPTKQLRFVVQKHHASRLHYDFRLEFDGTLKSWAVPKGPSLDPQVKRLAMMVEDHPLDYLTFEGTIPKGNYGAGDVIVWDIGVYHSSHTLDPKENIEQIRYGLKKGHVDFVLFGEKLKGHFSLIQIRNPKNEKSENSWLLMKHEDEYATAQDITKDETSVISDKALPDKGKLQVKKESRNLDGKKLKAVMKKEVTKKKSRKDAMPHDIRPMLATLTNEPFDNKDWLFEVKWDGYRAIAEIENHTVQLYSRKGNSYEFKFPPIFEALKTVAKNNAIKNAIFDGEIIALKDGRPDFHALQNYDETRAPLQYIIFDLLYYDGTDMRDTPLIERKNLLKSIFPKHPLLIFSDHAEKNGIAFFEAAKKEKFEGMIAKDAKSIYLERRRSSSWLKLKHFNEQEAVIVGFTEPRGGRKKFGALVLAAYKNGKLEYIGHSGGGFTENELIEMYDRLNKIKVKKYPFPYKIPINSPITWVKPKYICQVKFSEWTPDGRMRHPIYVGLREDKDPKEVVIEKPGETEDITGSYTQTFTNLDKIFWPKEKYTKGDIIEYYDKISEIILPHLKDRPESLHRHPNGIEGKSFFHKDIEMKVPEFVMTKKIWSGSNNRGFVTREQSSFYEDEKEIRYLVCQNKETLLYMANLGCIEINPWNSRIQNLDKPDYMIIDLDPGTRTFDELVKVALVVHEVLNIVSKDHFCKTSGKTGLHILMPLGAQYDYNIIRTFSQMIVTLVHRRMPEITSIERSPSKRRNKIYLDYLQNRRGQTIAAPYSLRPWPGATVSTPLLWSEVKKGLRPDVFTIKTIFKRIEKYGDLWKPVLRGKIDLEESIKKLQRIGFI